MKTIFAALITLLAIISAPAQNVKEAINLLEDLEDQYGNAFSLPPNGGDLILISIPTTDQPFRVYDQLKTAKFRSSVRIVGGFGNAGGHGSGMPIGHLKDGFNQKYGKDYQSIFLDGNSEVAKALSSKGHAIIIISPAKNKILKKMDYGNKIENFMKGIEEYKTK